ncbi:MAG: hypothetical protein IPJ62_16265 [Betaproteobacteria bacterium]|nr:hypothetical protein [Betaproteobacteria bacterium]
MIASKFPADASAPGSPCVRTVADDELRKAATWPEITGSLMLHPRTDI